MKAFQNRLRMFMAAGSLFAFFGGWALFAHAPKPAPVAAAPDLAPAPLPTLNVPSLQPNNKNQTSPRLQALPTLPAQRVMPMPRLRTHGS